VWWSGCIDPRNLDLSTSWMRVVSFTPFHFSPGEAFHGSQRIGGFLDPRCDVEKRTFLTLPGLEVPPLCRPACRRIDPTLRNTQLQCRVPPYLIKFTNLICQYTKNCACQKRMDESFIKGTQSRCLHCKVRVLCTMLFRGSCKNWRKLASWYETCLLSLVSAHLL
jgi:hypothetical protein